MPLATRLTIQLTLAALTVQGTPNPYHPSLSLTVQDVTYLTLTGGTMPKAKILLQRNEPVILATPFHDDLDINLTVAELQESFAVVEYDTQTKTFTLRDMDSEDSYNEYTLPVNHALLHTDPIQIVSFSDLPYDYYPVADESGLFFTDDDANAMNQLSLRVAKLEEAYQLLLADKPKTTRKHKETTPADTDATPE